MPALRLRVEFHLFLTALSVRPGSSLAIADHLLPFVSCAWGNNSWVRCCQDAAYMAICMSAGHCRRDCRKHGTLSEDEQRTLAHSQLCVGSTQCLTLIITASSHSEKAPFFTAGLRWFHHLQTVRAHNSKGQFS